MLAVPRLLFHEPPHTFDQVQVGGIGPQIKQFDLQHPADWHLVVGIAQHQCDGKPSVGIADGNLVRPRLCRVGYFWIST